MSITRIPKYEFSVSQSISGSFNKGDTVEASFLAKGNSSTINQYIAQNVDLKYSISSESISLLSFAKGTFPESFNISNQYITKSFAAGLPIDIQYIQFTLSGSLDMTGSNTYNSGGAANYDREVEVDYDAFKIQVHTPKTELTDEGILVFTSPNKYILANSDGVEIKGGEITAEKITTDTLEVFGDATIFGDVTATANSPYNETPQNIGTTATAGEEATFARGDHRHELVFDTLDLVVQEGAFTNISGSETSTGSFGAGYIDNKLGIGTTSPLSSLHVDEGDIRIDTAENGTQALRFSDRGTTKAQIQYKDNGETLNILTDGATQAITIDSNQKVGIGTTSPAETLDISGSGIKIHNGDQDGHLKFFRFSSEIGRISSANTRLSIKGKDNKAVSIEDTAGNIGFFLKDGGNVGIGTTSPSTNLEISASSDISAIKLSTTGSGNYAGGRIYLSAGAVGSGSKAAYYWLNAGRGTEGNSTLAIQRRGTGPYGTDGVYGGNILTYRDGPHAQAGWLFAAASHSGSSSVNNRFFISSSGDIGIGTISPTSKLHVIGKISSSDNITSKENVISKDSYQAALFHGDTGGPRLLLGVPSDDDAYMDFGARGGINKMDTKNRDFHLLGTNTTTGFYFDEGLGNFGIGTTSPSESLDLGVGGKIKLTSTDEVSGSVIVRAADQEVILSTENDTAAGDPQQFVLKHQLGNTELINRRGDLILSSSTKRIGINETNPVHALQVDGNISSSGTGNFGGNVLIGGSSLTNPQSWGKNLQVINAGSNGASISVMDSNNEYNIATYGGKLFISDGTAERISILSDGKVGIGTTAPSKALTVTGEISSSSTGSFQGGAVLDGNLGIGTTPSHQLHISQSNTSGRSTPLFIETHFDSVGGNPQLLIQGNKLGIANTLATHIELKRNIDYRAAGIKITQDDDVDEWFVGVPYKGGGFQIGFDTLAGFSEHPDSASLFISEVGKVGIGAHASNPQGWVHISASSDPNLILEDPNGSALLRFRRTDVGKNFDISMEGNDLRFIPTDKDGTQNVIIGANAASNKIDSRLGVGTATPSAELDVSGSIKVEGAGQLAMFSGSSGYQLEFDLAGQEKFDLSHGTSGLYWRKSNVIITGYDQNHDFKVFDSSGDAYATFDGSTARVGIGTATPTSELDVAGIITITSASTISDYNTTNFALRRGTGGEGILDAPGHILVNIDTNDNNTDRYFGITKDAGTEIFRVQEDGNVGIGTASPTYPLDVETDGEIVASFVSTDNKAGIQIADDDTTSYISSENGKFSLGANNGANANNINIDTSVNPHRLGIGTTAPTKELQVEGSISASGDIILGGDSTISTTHGTGDLAINPAAQLNLGTTSTDSIYIGRTDSLNRIYLQSGGANSLVVSASKIGINVEKPGLVSTSEAPNLKLEINGDVTIQDQHLLCFDHTYYNHAFMRMDNVTKLQTHAYYGHRFTSYPMGGSLGEDGRVVMFLSGSVSPRGARVGIGTENRGLTDELTVEGSISASGVVQVGNLDGASVAVGNLRVKSDSNHKAIMIEENSGNEAYHMGVNASGDFNIFNSGASTPNFVIADGNYVGINEPNPTEELQVDGHISASGHLKLQEGSDIIFQKLHTLSGSDASTIQWDFKNDDVRIYAHQSKSDATSMMFELSDNVNTTDSFTFWLNDWQGFDKNNYLSSSDAFPLYMDGTKAVINHYYDPMNTALRDDTPKDKRMEAGNIDFYVLKKDATHLTASLIHADVSRDSVLIQGTITASGDISSSGDIIATGTGSFEHLIVNADSGVSSNHKIVQIQKAGSNLVTIDEDGDTIIGGVVVVQGDYVYNDGNQNFGVYGANDLVLGMDWNNSADAHAIHFTQNEFDNTPANTLMIISSSGNVGIGTATPNTNLEVQSTGDNTVRFSTDGDAGDDILLQLYRNANAYGQVHYEPDGGTNSGLHITDFRDDANSHIIFNTRGDSEKMRIESDGKVGIGITGPTELLDVDGNIKARDKIVSETFESGFEGSGFRLETGSAGTKFTVDDLTVRGTMSVYEMLIHQIRATNGSLFVSNTGKIASASLDDSDNDKYSLFFDTGSNKGYGHTFQKFDLIRSQRFVPATNGSGSQVFKSDFNVVSTNGTASLEAVLTGSDAPQPGYEYVRIGNMTDSDRQGSIYLTSDDDHAPFIDVADGIDAHSDFNTSGRVKVRMGKLDGITTANAAFGTLDKYGFYASGSAYLEGSINATEGRIGGFELGPNIISSSNGALELRDNGTITGSEVRFTGGVIGGFTLTANELTATNFEINPSGKRITLGSGTDIFIADGDEGIQLGHGTFGSAPFSVTKAGVFKSVSGTIGSWNIHSDKIFTGTDEDVSGFTTAPGRLILSSSGAIHGRGFYLSKEGNVEISGSISSSAGNIGGWTLSSTSLTGENITLDSLNNKGEIELGAATSLDGGGTGTYMNGNGLVRFGKVRGGGERFLFDGTNFQLTASKLDISGSEVKIQSPTFLLGDVQSQFISGSGGDLVISSSNFHLFKGNITASNVDLTGKITATDGEFTGTLSSSEGNIGGWNIGTAEITNIDSEGGLSLDAGNRIITARTGQASSTVRVRFGEVSSGLFGIQGEDDSDNAIFNIGEQGNNIAGWTIDSNTLFNSNVTMSNANGGKISLNEDAILLSGSGEGILADGNIIFNKEGDTTISGQVTMSSDVLIQGGIEIGAFPEMPGTENLVGYWSFDESSGIHCLDQSGNNNTGSLKGNPSRISGSLVSGSGLQSSGSIVGNALHFDGTGDCVAITSSMMDAGSTDFTVTAWINPDNDSKMFDMIASQRAAGDAEGWQFDLRSGSYGEGMGLGFAIDDGPAAVTLNGNLEGSFVDSGSWHFVAATVDRMDGRVKTYHNAVFQKQSAALTSIDTDVKNDAPFCIGGKLNSEADTSVANAFSGYIDDVRVYNKVLSESELRAIYLNPGGTKTTKISGDQISTGRIQSNNLSATEGSVFELDGGTFKLGGETSPKLSWDGSTLQADGTISSSVGNLGGFTIDSNRISSANLVLSSSITDSDLIISTSKFNVKGDGQITASSVSMSGTISAESGDIGGWSLSSQSFSNGPMTLGTQGTFTGLHLNAQNNYWYSGSSEGVYFRVGGTNDYISFIGDSDFTTSNFEISSSNIHISGGSATFSGSITATDGVIGGFTLGKTAISAADLFEISASSTSGELFISSSQFKVTNQGQLTASNVSMSGVITATSGKIGEFTIGSTLQGGNIDIDPTNNFVQVGAGVGRLGNGGNNVIRMSSADGFFAGNASKASAPFQVGIDGKLHASDADIQGSITATSINVTSGSIGGFSITETSIIPDDGNASSILRFDADGELEIGKYPGAGKPFVLTTIGETKKNSTQTGNFGLSINNVSNTGYTPYGAHIERSSIIRIDNDDCLISVADLRGGNIFATGSSGHITASGNISASGTIQSTGNISTDGSITATSADINGAVDIDGGNLTIGTALQFTNGGVFNFGSSFGNGRITWDADYASLFGLANKKLRLGSFNTPGVLTISSSHENTMVISGSSVGIGTTSPSAKIHIDVDTADNQPALLIEKVSDQNETALIVNHGTSAADRGIADFQNSAGSKLYIRGDGNVGIGTSSPTKELQVEGDISASGHLYLKVNQKIGYTPNGTFGDGDDDENVIKFLSNGVDINVAERGILHARDAKIGINTDTPTKTLQVEGDISASGDLYIDGNVSAVSYGGIEISTGNNTQYFKLGTLAGAGARVVCEAIGQNTYSEPGTLITTGIFSIGNLDNEYGVTQNTIGDYPVADKEPTFIYKDVGTDTSMHVYIKCGTYFRGSVFIKEGYGFTPFSTAATPVLNPSGVDADKIYPITYTPSFHQARAVNTPVRGDTNDHFFLDFAHRQEDGESQVNTEHSIVAAFDGYVHSATVRFATAAGDTHLPGDTRFRVFKAAVGVQATVNTNYVNIGDGTAWVSDGRDSANGDGTGTNGRSVDMDSANGAAFYDFTDNSDSSTGGPSGDFTFNAGDRLAVSWIGTEYDGDYVNANLTLMYRIQPSLGTRKLT